MSIHFRTVFAALLCSLLLGEISPAADNPLQRQTAFGVVEGYADDASEVWAWKGIPFAKPPLAELRWRAPQDPEPWDGVRAAQEQPPKSLQPTMAPALTMLPEATGSEDCLYLNIFRPQTDEDNLPVYFWIHGGGNVFGSATGWYVQDLARKANIVLVEVQYRLGVFGYFTHPAFRSAKRGPESSGNFGTLDQVHALKWVRRNIAEFGGNPFNVTIGGHSGGGHDVAQLKICPLARGLFHRAVIHSEPWLAQSVADIDRTVNRTIENVLTATGAAGDPTGACRARMEMNDSDLVDFLRAVPASDLLKAHSADRPTQEWFPVWAPVIADGTVIPDHLYRVVESGRYPPVPTIISSTTMECGFANMNTRPQYRVCLTTVT